MLHKFFFSCVFMFGVNLPSFAVNSHGLQKVHIQALKVLGKPIAVPYYTPDTCKVDFVSIIDSVKIQLGGLGYKIQYVCKNALIYQIEATQGGIGDIPFEGLDFQVNNKQFGKIFVTYFQPSENGPEMKQPFYSTGWFDMGKGSLFFTFHTGNGRLDSTSPPLSKAEVLKIVASMGLLK
ncbi:MAG: hypothetical protein IV090_25025 [Candidatus Sericytochromatia bacterium]|nr:hypothetical protein [Candidatus Sericytochromatia bacterium]